MSRLEELINELCPDGVQYVTLEDISTDMFRGTGITRNQITDNGTPCVRYGEIYTTYGICFDKCVSYTNEELLSSKKYFEFGDILFAITGESVEDIAKSCAYLGNEKCLAGGDIVVLKHNQNPKYISYALSTTSARMQKSKNKVKNKVVHSSIPSIKEIIIPLPPLEIQQEIVRILDNLTDSTEKLKTKLQEELTARKKQYEYYRNKLLAFNDSNVDWMTLGQIGPVCMCKRIMKAQTNTKGEIPFYKIGTFGKEANAYISKEIYEKYKRSYKFPKKGDILISAAGTIGRTVVYNGEPAYFQDSNIVWIDNDESKVLNKFLIYCYAMNPWAVSAGGTIARLYNDNISKAKIPVPSLEKQKKIILIIEKFNLLYDNIFKELEMEIEARQKQYEYYRDKLLSFKELKKEGV